jgi:hypothetical protein
MDPYIERTEIFPDFHLNFLVRLQGELQPLLRPKYAALLVRRNYEVLRLSQIQRAPRTEIIRESVLHIIELPALERVVTAIDLRTPNNTTPALGQRAYQKHRQELWEAGSNRVEIDLLRRAAAVRDWHYQVRVDRRNPTRQEGWVVLLRRRLPRIPIPLGANDADVMIDLQAVFTRSWEEGPYPEILRYEGPPPGPMTDREIAWCENLLREAGYRPAVPANGNG